MTEQDDTQIVEEYIKGLPWSEDTPDDHITLVAGNLRAFWQWLKAKHMSALSEIGRLRESRSRLERQAKEASRVVLLYRRWQHACDVEWNTGDEADTSEMLTEASFAAQDFVKKWEHEIKPMESPWIDLLARPWRCRMDKWMRAEEVSRIPFNSTDRTDWFWWWDEDGPPVPVYVAYCPQLGHYFATQGQLGWNRSQPILEMGGWWMPLKEPATTTLV